MREIKYMVDKGKCLIECPYGTYDCLGNVVMVGSGNCEHWCEFFHQHATDHSIICKYEETKEKGDE